MDQCQVSKSNDEVGEPPPRSKELDGSSAGDRSDPEPSGLSPIAEQDGEDEGHGPEERSQPGHSGHDQLRSQSADVTKLELEGGSAEELDHSGQRPSQAAESRAQRGARPMAESNIGGDQSPAPIYMNDSFNEGGNASSPADDGLSGNGMQPNEVPHSTEAAQLPVRSQLALHDSYLAGQVRASSSYAAGAGAEVSGPAAGSQGSALGRFHWTMLMPFLYSALLLYMACLAGYFSLSGICFFALFIMHSYAYYGFRDSWDPIDMLTNLRAGNKSVLLRKIFKWCFIIVSLSYLAVLIVGRIQFEYIEVRTMMQDEDKERLRKDEIQLERNLSKIIPDFFSYWTIARAIVVVAAAFFLIKIQHEEEEEAQLVDQACLNTYQDVHHSRQLPHPGQPPANGPSASFHSQSVQNTQSNLGLAAGAFGAPSNSGVLNQAASEGASDDHQQALPLSAPNQAPAVHHRIGSLLAFRPYQVQKCVLIFKDYKFKAEFFVFLQILLLVVTANAQYCVYGLPYLALSLVQLLNIALSHSKTDQNIRRVSAIMTTFLVVYLPLDLGVHYVVHYIQESQRLDDEFDARYFDQPSHYQLQGYQGIMATAPSYVTFTLKIFLFILECMKFKYSYDMAEVYDTLKSTYITADSSSLPQSFPNPKNQALGGRGSKTKQPMGELGYKIQGLRRQDGGGGASESGDPKEEPPESTEEQKAGLPTQQSRVNQQAKMREKYNKNLKLQYVRIFRKSQSFVHKILQPVSLFMLCLTQLIFLLCHPSVMFLVLLGIVMTGFFVELKESQAQQSFTFKAKIILCVESLYVLCQYVFNIYEIGGLREAQRKEELPILLGLGTEQQLGYYEDDVSLFDNLFPFNYSIVFLFLISIFTRYMGKPKRQLLKGQMQGLEDRNHQGRASADGLAHPLTRSGDSTRSRQGAGFRQITSENSSERRLGQSGAARSGDDDMLTVFDDNMSISGISDLRSQRSRRSGYSRNHNDNQSQFNIDLYQNIIEEEEDENDIEEEQDDNDLNDQMVPHQSEQKSQAGASELDGSHNGAQIVERRSPNLGHAPYQQRGMPRINQRQSAFEFQNRLGARRRRGRRERHDPTRDSTLRGKVRQWFQKGYVGLMDLFDRLVDVLIVHINKLVLLALFLVSVYRPTLINVILFIMFLILSMVNIQNEYRFLRLTILINTLAICVIYTFDVFIQRDFSTIRTWVLHIIGVQYRSENVKSHIIKLKYLPYILLQIVLVLSTYVFQSDKYNHFKSQYMDIETQKHEMIAKQLTRRYQASQALSSQPGSGPTGSRYGGTVKRTNTISRKSGSNIDGDGESKSLNPLNKSGSAQSSFLKEGGAEEGEAAAMGQEEELKDAEDVDKQGSEVGEGRPPNDEDLIKGTKLPEKEESIQQINAADDHIEKMTIPDETKTNLLKQQEMIVMYDPASKFIIKNAAYFLVFFLFIEVVLLPLSIMNIILLVLMTIIVIKMLFCTTRIETYKSLANVLQVLSIFAIIYILSKYLFLFTEYTQNIQLKNSIENGYHQQGLNDDGTTKHSDPSQEQQKTEDARNQLHHSHDDESQGRSFSNKLLEKMFGFQKTEDQKNQGGTLLSIKLLNLAVVLSLTNLQLNILRHRNLAFLLGEREEVFRGSFRRSESLRQSLSGAASASADYLNDPEDLKDRVELQRIVADKKFKRWKKEWRWWHYAKVYAAFYTWFFLPISIVISSFYFYPLMYNSVPSVIMVLFILIILACNASTQGWRTIYKWIGTLVQVMICVCYILYVALIDQMASYDQRDPTQRQQFWNMKVLWGQYQSNEFITAQTNGYADDVKGASVLYGIIPLFAILSACFLFKLIDKWYEKNFNVLIHLDGPAKKELLRFKLREERDLRTAQARQEEDLNREVEGLQPDGSHDGSGDQPKGDGLTKSKSPDGLAAGLASEKKAMDPKGTKQKEDADKISLGTMGMDAKSAMEPEGSSEEQYLDEDGSVIRLNVEGELPERILESLLKTDPQTYAQCRGDGQWERGVTNQFLIDMIEELKSYEHEGLEADREELAKISEEMPASEENKEEKRRPEIEVSEASKVEGASKLTKEGILKHNAARRFVEEYLVDLVDYEAPFRHCYYFKNEIWLRFIAINGAQNTMIYIGLYAILNHMNLLSLLYWICLYRILKKNFKPNIFKAQPNDVSNPGSATNYNMKAKFDSLKNKQVLSLLKIQLAVISFMIIVQLSFSIYTNVQFAEQEDLQKSISNNFCPTPKGADDEDQYDEEGNIYQTAASSNPNNQLNKECAADWSYYLLTMTTASQSDEESQKNSMENQMFTSVAVTIDFLFLLLTYLLMFVSSGQLRLTQNQLYDHPVINDENDFVSATETGRTKQKFKNQTFRFMQTCFFVYMPYFLIVYLMYVSSCFNGQAVSDLLSSIYLWFALKFIINIKKLFSKNTKVLKPLRIYNRIVLFALLLYQMPVFLCPSAVDINGYTDPDYIDTEDCALIMHHQSTTPAKKQYEAKQPMQLYIILMSSLGLMKQNYINMTFLFLFFLTEAQHQIFQHPHFKEYVVKHMILEKESHCKVRAFMYVERHHLTKLWAYRAIKEEIKILHKILLRLNDQIRKSDFAKNLAGFVEYQQQHSSPQEDESSALLPDSKKQEDPGAPAEEQIGEESAPDKLTKDIEEFIELNSHIIDSIALDNLQEDKPIIPLKIIQNELKLGLKKEIESGTLSIQDIDEDKLKKYVFDLIDHLEGYVYTKNRIDLYHQEGLGLMLALDDHELEAIEDDEKRSELYEKEYRTQDGCSKTSKTKSAEQYLKEQSARTLNRQNLYQKLYKSYNDAIMSRGNNQDVGQDASEVDSKRQASDHAPNAAPPKDPTTDQNPSGSSSSGGGGKSEKLDPNGGGSDGGPQRTDSQKANSDQDFNPSPVYYQIDEAQEEEAMKDMTWTQRMNYQIRLYLWTNYVDHILFMHLEKTKDEFYLLRKPSLSDYGILRLLEASFSSRSSQIVYIAIVFNFIMNGNLISLFIVVTVMGFSILNNPLPSSKFWKFMMSYMLTIISLKFLYQLPIFCGTPVYTFYSDKCNNEDLIPQVLASRVDYIIGIHKFSGPASYPRNTGIFYGILADVLLLMALLLHKQYLSKIGAWNYVKTHGNIYKNPSFNIESKNIASNDGDSRNPNQRMDLLAQQHHDVFIYDQSAWYEKAWYNVKKFSYQISNFYGKVLPQYMHRKQKNLDARQRMGHPFITHKFKKVKPGKDYFTPIFFILLLIVILTLIYWKNISGEDKAQSFGAATLSLDRFSAVQVITLLMILILLLLERMLYRARYVDERDLIGKYQSQPDTYLRTGARTFGQPNAAHGQSDAVVPKARSRKTAGSRHTLTIKLMIYYSLVVLIHVYLGFTIPLFQLAPMYQNPWLSIYYLLWCAYLYYSGLQIRHGYPMQPYKQTFSKDTSLWVYNIWRAYKAIPFIWEMKVIIDWTVTSTCLDLFQWFKLDDAYNTLYYNSVQSDQRKSRPEFTHRSYWEKIFQGFCFALLLIFVILAPIFLFSGINPIMVKNPVKAGTLTIDIELIATGNSYRIFETQANRILPLTKTDDNSWRLYFEPDSNQIDFQDMQKLQFNTYAESQWTISPPSLKKFINDFKSISKDQSKEANIVNFKAYWSFNRDNPTGKEKTQGYKVIQLTKKDMLPVIEMLERDNQVLVPHVGLPHRNLGSSMMQLSQLDSDDFEYVMLKDDDDEEDDDDTDQTNQELVWTGTETYAERGAPELALLPQYPLQQGQAGFVVQQNGPGQPQSLPFDQLMSAFQGTQLPGLNQQLPNHTEARLDRVTQNSSRGFNDTANLSRAIETKATPSQASSNQTQARQTLPPDLESSRSSEEAEKKAGEPLNHSRMINLSKTGDQSATNSTESQLAAQRTNSEIQERQIKSNTSTQEKILSSDRKQMQTNKSETTIPQNSSWPSPSNRSASVVQIQSEKFLRINNSINDPSQEASNTSVATPNDQIKAAPLNPSAPIVASAQTLDTPEDVSKNEVPAYNVTASPDGSGAPDGTNDVNGTVGGGVDAQPLYYPNGTVAPVAQKDEFEYKEVEEGGQRDQEHVKLYKTGKARIAVKDAFPKIIHLNAQTDINPLAVTELQANTSKFTSMELQLNRQGNSIYYWTFSLGTSDGRGGKNHTAYLRDTPGVFNSRNSQDDVEMENKAEKRKQSTSKVEKKLREKDKAEMSKKKVQEEQNLVILVYNEEVIGSFFGSALQLSVVGLYATIVIAIGRFIRIIFDRISQRVMYEELPNTKQLFEICEGIFIAQQEGDLVREKQLYDLLILMYRSPEALIKITGTRLEHKEESKEELSTQGSDYDAATVTGSGSSATTRRRRGPAGSQSSDSKSSPDLPGRLGKDKKYE